MVDNRYIIIGILALVALFIWYRRLSGFIVTQERVPLSIMDLQEFSYLSSDQKAAYRSNLAQSSTVNKLTSNAMNVTNYVNTLSAVLANVMGGLPNLSPSTYPSLPTCPPGITLMGECTSMATCLSPLVSTTINGKVYCKCPPSTPLLSASSNGMVTCVAQCPTTQPHRSTEAATGQVRCETNCPPPSYLATLSGVVTCI